MNTEKLTFSIKRNNNSCVDFTFFTYTTCINGNLFLCAIDDSIEENFHYNEIPIISINVENLRLEDKNKSIIFKDGYKITEHRTDNVNEHIHYLTFERKLEN